MSEVFLFPPNWSEGVEHQLSFKTDIFTSRSGKEQRRALRQTPRRTVSFSAMVVGPELVKFQRLMATKQNAEFQVPDWTRFIRTHGAEQGATYFTVRETVPSWLVVGTTAMLLDGETYVPVTVSSVSGFTVEVVDPISQAVGETAILRPVFLGLQESVSAVSNTSSVASIRVTLDVKPGSLANNLNLYTPFLTGGYEVFGFNWNWGESVSSDFAWPVEQVDFQRGVTANYRPVNFGTTTQKATVVRQSEQIDTVLRFVERQKGQRGQFWMPTGTSDMEMLSDIANGASTFTVAGSEVYEQFSADPVYAAVAIYTRDARKVFRKVGSITLSGGNSVIHLISPVTFAIPTALVAKVSWMRAARMASDDQTVEFLTDNVAQLNVTTSSVTFTADSQDYAEPDGSGYWVMDNWGEDAEALMDSINQMVNVTLPLGDPDPLTLSGFDDLINSEMWTALT